MQKKIIALAVAGLVSGAAFAQSNVTVFGIVDMGYQYSWGDTKDGMKNSKSEIKAGGQDGSRFGLRGSEDLGNGLKANFEMAAGYDADIGSSYGGRLMSEGAWVGLEGASWGQVKAGYFGSFIDDATGVDVTGRIGVSSSGLMGTGKYQNFVAWYSPVWSGLQVKAGYSSNAGAQDVTANDLTSTTYNVRAYTAAASYANGGLKLQAAYASFNPQNVDTLPNTRTGNEWIVGAAYDFGVVSVSGLYQAQKNGLKVAGTGSYGPNGMDLALDKRDFWALGLKVPFGAKDSVAFGYGEIKNNYFADISDDKAHAFTITYLHTLSKRTNVYALYGNVSGDDYMGATDGTQAYSIGGYKNAFNVGVRHQF